MVRGLYSSAAGALVAQADIDVIANNLANSVTSGFKRALLQVQSQPTSGIYRYQTDPGQLPDNRTPGVPTQSYVGPLGSGSEIYATPTNFQQGALTVNNNPFSFALSGPGFFAVRNANNQTTYTRDGAFVLGSNGLLSTEDGETVLGSNGQPIPIPPQGTIQVDTSGNILLVGGTQTGQTAGGTPIGRIGVTEFTNLNALQPLGNGRFLGQNAGAHAATQTTLQQNMAEQSNSNVITSMVDLITAQRWFEANEKSIQTQVDATNQAITTVGRTN